MRIITGALAFFDSSAGIISEDLAGDLAAEAATGVFADEHDSGSGPYSASARSPASVCAVLCVPDVNVDLSVLPVRQAVRGSSVWWLVSGVTKCFVEHQRGILETSIESPNATRPAPSPWANGRVWLRRSRLQST